MQTLKVSKIVILILIVETLCVVIATMKRCLVSLHGEVVISLDNGQKESEKDTIKQSKLAC